MLNVAGLCKTFGGIRAVDDVTLDVESDQIVGLIGPNGAGKTTLFNLISGFDSPDAGRVTYAGSDVTRLSPHKRAKLGLVRTFQHSRVFPTMTVTQNVMVGSHRVSPGGVRGVRRSASRMADVVEAAVADFGLEPIKDELASSLSYGDMRRVAIAAAAVAAPQLLLLDEPAAGLNYAETISLQEDIVRMRLRGCSVFLVEHDVSLIMKVCDVVAVLNSGRLIAMGSPDDVKSDPAVEEAYLGA